MGKRYDTGRIEGYGKKYTIQNRKGRRWRHYSSDVKSDDRSNKKVKTEGWGEEMERRMGLTGRKDW